MISHSDFFAEYVDAIHSVGGRLVEVVTNVAEAPDRSYRLADRIRDCRVALGEESEPEVRITPLEEFVPREGQQYLLGNRNPAVQRTLADYLEERHGIAAPPLIHDSAMVSPLAKVGLWSFVGAGAVIAANVSVGKFTRINRGATVGHDNRIGDHCDIGPGSNTAGWVTIHDEATLGIGVNVIPNRKIGESAVVGGGAVVIRDVGPGVTVVGNPAVEKGGVSRKKSKEF